MSLDDVRSHYQQHLEAVPAGEERGRPLTNKAFSVVINDEVIEHLAAAEKEQLLA
jgi:2-polyprenyl-3-methyl-5-hydroxy-6-metoxy-1,4-benzoquinol methylase